jgi:hypothetical protein
MASQRNGIVENGGNPKAPVCGLPLGRVSLGGEETYSEGLKPPTRRADNFGGELNVAAAA